MIDFFARGTMFSFDSAICLPVSVLFSSRRPLIVCGLIDWPLITTFAIAVPESATTRATKARTKAGEGRRGEGLSMARA